MKKVDSSKKIFKTALAIIPNEDSIKRYFELLGNNDEKPSSNDFSDFKAELLNIIKDHNVGTKNFSKHIQPSQKIKSLQNIQDGCYLIHSNIHLYDDPHLKYQFESEQLEKMVFKQRTY